ncbi:MAG: hypothetical protein K5668_10855 [Lachnospiraceae bacterium]|nr:hypothetical protein [Lachnospiraceae bacterium]
MSLIPAVIHWILSFFTDRLVFSWTGDSNIFNYIGCKAVLLVLLIMIWKAIIEHKKDTLLILKYAGIYLIPLIFVLVFKLPQGYLSNDESLIYEEARVLSDYTWFSYLTTWYYIISMMLIPWKYGPIIVKVVIQALVCGYCVKRVSGRYGEKTGYFTYIPFLFYPVMAYTTSAHRIPVYFLLYAFLLVKLYFDKDEDVVPEKKMLLWVLFLGAVLTQWRTEGIYLLALIPILLFITYPSLRDIKKGAVLITAFILIQYLVSVPQNGIIPGRMGDKANNRMAPFYAYTIVNMMRNGLDRDANKEDLEKAGRYLDLEKVDRINEDLGDINYEDVLILYYPGYTGVREDVTPEDYNAYTEGCMNIFKNNPAVFFVTRSGAFDYAARPYHIGTDQGGVKGLIKLVFSVVKALFYNLYIPCVLLLAGCVVFLIKRKWFEFFAAGGLIGHFIIVFILAPASYFKYYFPIYFTVYLYLTLAGIGVFAKKRQ